MRAVVAERENRMLNEIWVCNTQRDQQIAFDPCTENRIPAASCLSISSENIHWQALDINKKACAGIK